MLERNDEALSSQRRRWFEQVVMVPVSIGALFFFGGLMVANLTNLQLSSLGQWCCSHNALLSTQVTISLVSGFVAGVSSARAVYRWHHR